MKKRNLLLTVLLGIMLMLAACGTPKVPEANTSTDNGGGKKAVSGEVKEITVAGNGGKIEQLIRDEIGPKFTEETGIKINYVAGLSGEIYAKLELQKNSPQIDVATFTPGDVVKAGNADLIEQVDSTVFPNLDKMDNKYIYSDKGVPIFGYTVGIAYNTAMFEKEGWAAPTSWNDMYRAEFKGKTAYPEVSNAWGHAAFYNLGMANGGDLENIDPAIDKAKQVAAISDTFYKNSTQLLPVLQQETAAISILANYVVTDLVDGGLPIKMVIPEEGAPLQSLTAVIVKNTPKKEAAEQFINFVTEETSQKIVAESGFYPVLTDVSLPENIEEIIGISDAKVYTPDFELIAKESENWIERFAKEVVPELGKGL
ncbi:putative spermidine/putrescine transport system substrate-binding protein [Sporosarcina luteola]|nr:putative spermidine/putrescine transport system substrate-binding protein [Sporosarcina luteola]